MQLIERDKGSDERTVYVLLYAWPQFTREIKVEDMLEMKIFYTNRTQSTFFFF